MSARSRVGRCAVLITGLAIFTSVPAAAQPGSPPRSLAVQVGTSQYDLSGTGWGPFVATRGRLPWIGPVVIEPGLEVFTYDSRFEDRHTLLLPEVQLQLMRGEGRVRPYGGVGGGIMLDLSDSGAHGDWTLSASAGSRFALSDGLDLIGELRLRSLTPWTGSMADLGVGLAWDS
ncbi:MAG TPA: hypothetical protein VFG78_12410 [Gemmatimonadota bacterium]|nr:hypothetical protein [Gemmatimonadota bacterium]